MGVPEHEASHGSDRLDFLRVVVERGAGVVRVGREARECESNADHGHE